MISKSSCHNIQDRCSNQKKALEFTSCKIASSSFYEDSGSYILDGYTHVFSHSCMKFDSGHRHIVELYNVVAQELDS